MRSAHLTRPAHLTRLLGFQRSVHLTRLVELSERFLYMYVSQDLKFVPDISKSTENHGQMNILEISIFESLHLEDYWELRVHISQADEPVHEYS